MCKEWHNYDNFKDWCLTQSNYNKWINAGTKEFALDKDIIPMKKENRYCPENCCFVPTRVNSLFTAANKIRGTLPLGVCKDRDKFRVTLKHNGKTKNLGSFSTPEAAFQVYKAYKEDVIQTIANEEIILGNITQECYNSMVRWKIKITD